MKEFMVFVRTEGDHLASMSSEEQQLHVAKIGAYINNLAQRGSLKSAQPLEQSGSKIYCQNGVFKDGPFIESKEIIVGYFLITAENLEKARDIAKANPVFEATNGSIEIRPVKTLENIN